MDKRFEKALGILMIMALIGLVVFNIWEGNLYGVDGRRETETANTYISSSGLINEYPGILRFHVVANSDSKEDQELKLKVRDYVLERVQGALAQEIAMSTDYSNRDTSSSGNANDTGNASDDLEFILSQNKVIKEYVTCQLPLIEQWADEAIELYGYEYDTTAGIGIRHIPAKYYEELFFPEGNYEALTITIGDGAGQNWWCVVFPPLCLIESASNEAAYENNSDKTHGNSSDNTLSDSDFSDNQQLILKSKTMELLQNQGSADGNSEFSISKSCSNSISKSFVCLFE